MEELIKFGYSTIYQTVTDELMFNMEPPKIVLLENDQKVWFSMWFLGAIITFGAAFFPMFYRLTKNRNHHFRRERQLKGKITTYLKQQNRTAPKINSQPREINAALWAVSIILIVPVFIITYLLSKDLALHEAEQERFLAQTFPERIFMTQTIPIKTYAIITIVTLGVGIIYWLYKVVNQYNAHYRAHVQLEQKISSLMEEIKVDNQ